MKRFPLLFLLAAQLFAQQPAALLSRSDAIKLYQQVADLMESASIAVPELAHAGRPMIESAKADARALQGGSTYDNTAVLDRFLTSLRVYLQIADAVPKPSPFAEEAQRQVAVLRQDADRLEAHFRALLELREQQVRNADRDNLRRYGEANRALGPPSPDQQRVVFLGDSITDRWHINEYFPGKPYVNRGIGGQITGEMLGRMKADVIDLKPAAVLILAGTNDIGRGVSVPALENNLIMIADLAATYHIKPIFASILPISDYHKDQDTAYERSKGRPPETIVSVNQWLQSFCRQRGYTYLDYFSAMVDDKGFLKADLADDGLHPNAAGYRIMGPLAQAAIDRTVPPVVKKKRRLFGGTGGKSGEPPTN